MANIDFSALAEKARSKDLEEIAVVMEQLRELRDGITETPDDAKDERLAMLLVTILGLHPSS